MKTTTRYMKYFTSSLIFLLLVLLSCKEEPVPNPEPKEEEPTETVEEPDFYRGADLSYVNEMLDCGAAYLNKSGVKQAPYEIFEEAGCNLVRLRLWHTPKWTNYSNYEDVQRSIAKAKAEEMRVLLDFHYSDD